MPDSWGTAATPDPERQRKAREYTRISRLLGIVDMLLGLAALLALALTGGGEWLRDRTDGLHWTLQAPLFAGIIAVVYATGTAPLTYVRGFAIPKRFGILTQPLTGWLRDRMKAAAVGAVIGFALLEVLYFTLHQFGGAWWAVAAVLYTVAFVGLAAVAPVLLFPLFYKVEPLEDVALVDRIRQLAARVGARVQGVYVWGQSAKGPTANAALMGLGSTRRVVLSDTLLDRYTPGEIEVILAHELAHQVRRDIPKGVAIQAVTTFAIFGLAEVVLSRAVDAFDFAGRWDVAAFPVLALALSVLGYLAGPVVRGYSRHAEAEADRYALRATNRPADFMSMMTKLTDQNLGEAEPSRLAKLLFYDHPTYRERIAIAQAYQEAA